MSNAQSQSSTPVRLYVTQPDELSAHNTIHRSFDNATNLHESTALSINSVYEHRIESATMNAITTWVTDHLYQTAVHVANGVILCTLAANTVPVFSALGFSAAGPAASIDPIYFDKARRLTLPRNRSKWCHGLLWLSARWWNICDCAKRSYRWLWSECCC
jgi:hypothetical protein